MSHFSSDHSDLKTAEQHVRERFPSPPLSEFPAAILGFGSTFVLVLVFAATAGFDWHDHGLALLISCTIGAAVAWLVTRAIANRQASELFILRERFRFEDERRSRNQLR